MVYYVTPQLVYITEESSEVTCDSVSRTITFRGQVCCNKLAGDPAPHYLCGRVISEDALITIPANTPKLIF
jgi:hypothetical protein